MVFHGRRFQKTSLCLKLELTINAHECVKPYPRLHTCVCPSQTSTSRAQTLITTMSYMWGDHRNHRNLRADKVDAMPTVSTTGHM